jgi:FixJ family two-component response regulator
MHYEHNASRLIRLEFRMPEKPLATVFVVDDEAIIATTVAAILNMSGFNVTSFNSAADTLQAAETGCPDLLITDVSMPGMNGIDLAIRFPSLYPNCEVVLISGHMATAGTLVTAKDQGHDFTILAKPVHSKVETSE